MARDSITQDPSDPTNITITDKDSCCFVDHGKLSVLILDFLHSLLIARIRIAIIYYGTLLERIQLRKLFHLSHIVEVMGKKMSTSSILPCLLRKGSTRPG